MSALQKKWNTISEGLQELEKNASELDRDVLLADVRAFYDVVKKLELKEEKDTETVFVKQNIEPVVAPAPERIPEPPKAEPIVADTKPDPLAEATNKIIFNEVEKQTETPEIRREPLIAVQEPEADYTSKNILAGMLNKTPLEDLRSGIPLNEKFGIIRTLFNGNASDFGDAVLKLNNAASVEEMSHYLTLLRQRFSWDTESEAYTTFAGYVERRKMAVVSSNT